MSDKLIHIDPASEMLSGANSMPFSNKILLIDVNLAKTEYSQKMEALIPELTKGTELKMVRDEEWDPFGISMSYRDEKLGVVPCELTPILARLMDAGKQLVAEVVKAEIRRSFHSPTPFVRIVTKIYLID